MIKKLLYLITIVLLLAGAGLLVAIAPYHIYTLTLTEGVDTRFLTMSSTRPELYDGENVEIKTPAKMEDETLYQIFHFGNFELPMPVNHQLFSLIPLIRIEPISPRLGARFQNGKNAELFSFMLEKPYKFETTTGEQKIFALPIFKNYNDRKSSEEIWSDLFNKKLSLPSNDGQGFFDSLIALRKVAYNDLVYNLFILYNRRFIMPSNTVKMSYYAEKNMGIVQLPSDDPKIKVERLFIVEKGLIYPVVIHTRTSIPAAANFRAKFILEINYKISSPDSAISIYARYKQIPYVQRIDQQGMTYLYSAWSHDLSNRDFVRVIILFLERGTQNLKYLKPFYEYAYKKFGSTLSSASGFLDETAAEKLKRQLSDDLEGEIKKEADQATIKTEGQFETPEDKIKYNLQKAKDSKQNSDDNDKVLMIE